MRERVLLAPHKRVIVRRARNMNVSLSTVRCWRDFRTCGVMSAHRPNPASLRAEARLLTIAGVILLTVGFPLTLFLVAQALTPGGMSPVLPIAAGAPPLMLGYIACHFASARLARARSLEGARAHRSVRASA